MVKQKSKYYLDLFRGKLNTFLNASVQIFQHAQKYLMIRPLVMFINDVVSSKKVKPTGSSTGFLMTPLMGWSSHLSI